MLAVGRLAIGDLAIGFGTGKEFALSAPVAVAGRTQLRLDFLQLIDERLGEPLNAAAMAAVAKLGGKLEQALRLRFGQLRILQPLFGFDDQLGDGDVQRGCPGVERADRQVGGFFLKSDFFDGCPQSASKLGVGDSLGFSDCAKPVQRQGWNRRAKFDDILMAVLCVE